MNCDKAQRWMSLEFDDALSERRVERLNAHLAVCAKCREVREQWLRLRTACRSQTRAETPNAEEVWRDVQQALRNEPVAHHDGALLLWEWLNLRRPALAFAAAMLLLAIGLGTWMLRVKQASQRASPRTLVEFVETGLPGAAPMVYQDIESGWTVIWVVEADDKEKKNAGT